MFDICFDHMDIKHAFQPHRTKKKVHGICVTLTEITLQIKKTTPDPYKQPWQYSIIGFLVVFLSFALYLMTVNARCSRNSHL